jgi:WbqC-like protein family
LTTLAILQPGFLPWLGFFDQMIRSDVFVLYDDVQFDKHGWRNRNRIKTANGTAWLTVPMRHSGRQGQSIREAEIDNSRKWARKLVETVRQAYAGAPHREPYSLQFAQVLAEPGERLLDLDVRFINLISSWLDIRTQVVRSSDLGIEGSQSGRLIEICRHFGARRYLSGNAAKAYLDTELFDKACIEVVWQDYVHPRYRQLHGEFVPYLSALDLVLNMGPESPKVLRGSR